MKSWPYLWREAFVYLLQNPLLSLSAITTVFVLQLILGAFILAWLNLDHWTKSFTRQVQVVAFLKDDLDDSERSDTTKKIQLINHVRQVHFVSKDQAFKELQRELQGKVTLEDVGENPLPDRIDVQVDDASHLPSVAERLVKVPGIAKVKYGGDVAKRLVKVSRSITYSGLLISSLLVLATVTVIGNTIRITVHSRRNEIRIMQMVGATREFIRSPFILEGITQGLIGSVSALLILGLAYQEFCTWLAENMAFIPGLPPESFVSWFVAALIALGGALGATGSAISVNRYLEI